MVTTRILQAVLPNHLVVYRETAREYTHVVCAKFKGDWYVECWTTKPEQALKEVQRIERRYGSITDVRLLPVTLAKTNPRRTATRKGQFHVITFVTPSYRNVEWMKDTVAEMARYANAIRVDCDFDALTVTLTFKSYHPEFVIARAKSFLWKVKED